MVQINKKSHEDSFPSGKKSLRGFFEYQSDPRIDAECSLVLRGCASLRIKRLLPFQIKELATPTTPPLSTIFVKTKKKWSRIFAGLFMQAPPLLPLLPSKTGGGVR
jgi:hypothetical protein